MTTNQVVSILVLAALCAIGATAAEVTGHVRILGGSERSVTVVWAEPEGEHPVPKPGQYSLQQHDKTFIPHVLAVPVGSTVSFPNSDPIFHNVFSLSRPQSFDLGLYRAGDSKSKVFTKPAIYRVFCNIHPQMTGIILVLPTAYITEADGRGAYHFDLPTGHYRVTAWSEKSEPTTNSVNVESGTVSVPDLILDESKFVGAAHKNKYGQDYPASAYDPNKR